ncbi:glycosyltransferase [Desulfovibrio sp. MES5]|uniref:glycosyltransferase n=1 Tax=Desulfovibrio sp. MES5 TaxID=1899016 RepID=UPI0025C2A1D4|nr:glycosyltransferase [Desulfovibrio sp. MES5]
MMTYNHAAFIREALDSCLGQKTEYPFEIIVCDDASTDGTVEILQAYAHKHPSVVLSLQSRNTKGAKNLMDGMQKVRGVYVALCEGDDYWTNPGKLQKQVSFMEANPDFSVCCHRVEIMFDPPLPAGRKQYVYKNCKSEEARIREGVFYADEAIANYFFHTSSFVFRWRFPNGLPEWFTPSMTWDQFLFMLHAVQGKIKYFDDDMSVWRRHESGYSWLQTIDKKLFFAQKGLDWLAVFKQMDAFFSYRFTLQIRERVLLALRNTVDLLVSNGKLDTVRNVVEGYSEYFEKPVLENASMLDALRLAFPEKNEFCPPWAAPRVLPQSGDEPAKTAESPPAVQEPEYTEQCRPIGGMFEPAITLFPESPESVWNTWTDGREYACFTNPDQAVLTWLWEKAASRRVWVPSYYPHSTRDALNQVGIGEFLYECRADMTLSHDFLAFVEPGDAVISMTYMGKSVSPEFEQALLARPDILWLEDRRHALLPERPSKAQAVLYDPTEFLGVPDGAILVGAGVACLQPARPAASSDFFDERVINGLRRFDLVYDMKKALLEQAKTEKQWELPSQACSRLTRETLKRVPVREMADRSKANWRYLARHLATFAFFPEADVDFAPWGFPVRVPFAQSAAVIYTALQAQGIFCRKNFTPYKKSNHSIANMFAARLLILPCDHRYGRADMEKVVYFANRFLNGTITPADVQA